MAAWSLRVNKKISNKIPVVRMQPGTSAIQVWCSISELFACKSDTLISSYSHASMILNISSKFKDQVVHGQMTV